MIAKNIRSRGYKFLDQRDSFGLNRRRDNRLVDHSHDDNGDAVSIEIVLRESLRK